MAKVIINRFDGGIGNDLFDGNVGVSAISKGFDTLTYPYRLSPVRSMQTDTSGQTGIGNLIVGADGHVYGLGTDAGNPGKQDIYVKSPTQQDAWAEVSNSKSGYTVDYNCFVEYKGFLYALNNSRYLGKYDRTGVGSANTTFGDLSSYTNSAQGLVHPKDDVLYIPYDNKIASVNGTTFNATALNALPSTSTVTAIAPYGNYLAIMCVPTIALTYGSQGNAFHSTVFLWDRDSSLNTTSESIDWGTGVARVLANLNGALIGISDTQGSSVTVSDSDSIVIKQYTGGEPQLVREIITQKFTASYPSVTINPRVSFVFRNRLYFSIDVVGGSTSPTYYGLWSIGRSKISNQYVVNIERPATSGDTETSVLAAATVGDFFSIVHTAVGTVTVGFNGSSGSDGSSATVFSFPAYWESVINPGMKVSDMTLNKQLKAISLAFRPLGSAGQIVLKYRVDAKSGWTAIATYTAASASAGSPDSTTGFERMFDASNNAFTSGRFYEFRIESTGGAEVVELAYRYEVLKTNMID